MTHIADPLALVHVRDLPAEIPTGPIEAVTPAISVEEYCTVH